MLGEYAKLGAPALLLIALGFALAFHFVGPAPPERIAIASGEPDGAYAAYAARYREHLARFDIELEVRHTAGSAENLALLRSGEVDIALVQGGVAEPREDESLQALGSLYFEPLWIFERRGLGIERLSQLAGLRIAAGPEGSGTRAVAQRLLAANGVDGPTQDLRGSEAVSALRAGELDVAFLVASASSSNVRALLSEESVALLSLTRADAYTRTYRFLSRLTLPEGAIDLAHNIPPSDVVLIAPTANLVASEGLHPALVDVILQAAERFHRDGGLFESTGEFPAPRYLDLPLSPEARRFYEHGPPFLQRYLPFWLATLVDRLKIMLIPLIALLIPVFRALGPLYRWRVRSRIYRWYTQIGAIDPAGRAIPSADAIDAALAEVNRIETEVGQVPAPASYARELYDLRLHIGFVRGQLSECRTAPSETPETTSGAASG